MITHSRTLCAVLLLTSLGTMPAPAQDVGSLDLAGAEHLALEEDRTTPALRAQAEALQERAVAAGQLPDPRLRLGAMNFPTDTFSRGQEPMTQLQVGVQQAFPPGDSLRVRQQQLAAMAEAGRAGAGAQARAVRRDVRLRYLELYYQWRASRIMDSGLELFERLREVAEYQYASGRKNQQDVLRAGVELALLEDRRTRIDTDADTARAALARLIGTEAAQRPLAETFPVLPPLPSLAALEQGLDRHPVMQVEDSRVEAGRQGVNLARQSYKPGWMLDITYGERTGHNADGGARSDFLSAMVVMDIPLFADKRQDPVLAAEHQDLMAAQLNREDRHSELRRMLAAGYAEWLRLDQRLARYTREVLPQAEQNTEASLSAYQSGVTDFSGLMRARLTELDSRLMALRLRVDQAMAQARLLYLQENHDE